MLEDFAIFAAGICFAGFGGSCNACGFAFFIGSANQAFSCAISLFDGAFACAFGNVADFENVGIGITYGFGAGFGGCIDACCIAGFIGTADLIAVAAVYRCRLAGSCVALIEGHTIGSTTGGCTFLGRRFAGEGGRIANLATQRAVNVSGDAIVALFEDIAITGTGGTAIFNGWGTLMTGIRLDADLTIAASGNFQLIAIAKHIVVSCQTFGHIGVVAVEIIVLARIASVCGHREC